MRASLNLVDITGRRVQAEVFRPRYSGRGIQAELFGNIHRLNYLIKWKIDGIFFESSTLKCTGSSPSYEDEYFFSRTDRRRTCKTCWARTAQQNRASIRIHAEAAIIHLGNNE
jgi:hypothetical protein